MTTSTVQETERMTRPTLRCSEQISLVDSVERMRDLGMLEVR